MFKNDLKSAITLQKHEIMYSNIFFHKICCVCKEDGLFDED